MRRVTKNIVIVEQRKLLNILKSFVTKDIIASEKSTVIPDNLNFIEEISQDINYLAIHDSRVISSEES